MKTRIVEVTNHPTGINWGKFLVGQFDTEWSHPTAIGETSSLLRARGWTREHVLVLDLETGEGAVFRLGGKASYDLNEKHQVWVCPMFEPFLNWLYASWDGRNVDDLPNVVELTESEAPSSMGGYRRQGRIRALVDEQAEDEGLWFEAETAAEAYLQQELRRLHRVIEGEAEAD